MRRSYQPFGLMLSAGLQKQTFVSACQLRQVNGGAMAVALEFAVSLRRRRAAIAYPAKRLGFEAKQTACRFEA